MTFPAEKKLMYIISQNESHCATTGEGFLFNLKELPIVEIKVLFLKDVTRLRLLTLEHCSLEGGQIPKENVKI